VINDGTLPDLLRDNRYKCDAIHLAAGGYRQLAEALHRLLVEQGAL
jgi:acyl-CoA thioesterase-1